MDTELFDWNDHPNANETENPAEEAEAERPEKEAAEQTAAVFAEQTERPAETAFVLSPDSGESATPPAAKAEKAEKPKKHAKRGIGRAVVAISLVCALLGGAVGAGAVLLINDNSGTPAKTVMAPNSVPGRLEGGSAAPGQNTSAPEQNSPAQLQTSDRTDSERTPVETVISDGSGTRMNASQVYEQNVNSTVGITTEVTTYNFFGYPTTGAAAGSGFILTSDGYILTNQHVIDGANSITVTMYNGDTYAATLVGEDASNDIAVLKIEANGLTPVTLGSSDSLKVGEDVLAIDNPLGELTFSLTRGAVSALNRPVTLSNGVTMNLIQTDCAINSGNSGGALFNLYGEVVGITNAKYSSNSYSNNASIDNIGFAIPINQVKDIVNSIIQLGYISKPYIGVTVSEVSEESLGYGLPRGEAIKSIEKDSPAEKAGLQVNDIITAVNGKEITDFEVLKNAINEGGIGAELELQIYRRGTTLTVSVTVGEKIQQAKPSGGTDGRNGTPQQTPAEANPFGSRPNN